MGMWPTTTKSILSGEYSHNLIGAGTRKVSSLINTTRAFISRNLRVWTDWTRTDNALFGIVVFELRGNDFRRRNPKGNPPVECANDIAFGIIPLVALLPQSPEAIRAGASVTVVQAGHHKQPEEVVRRCPLLLSHVIVVLDCSQRRS